MEKIWIKNDYFTSHDNSILWYLIISPTTRHTNKGVFPSAAATCVAVIKSWDERAAVDYMLRLI
jgi:hypothetical protein